MQFYDIRVRETSIKTYRVEAEDMDAAIADLKDGHFSEDDLVQNKFEDAEVIYLCDAPKEKGG